jgi:FkbM family methyltransferase
MSQLRTPSDLERQLDALAPLQKASRIKQLAAYPCRLLYSKFLYHCCSVADKSVRLHTRLFWGDHMTVLMPDPVSKLLYQYGFYEEGLTRILLRNLKTGMRFLDVGSHLGYFSLLASTLVGPEGQVHAFEPTPSTFTILTENCRGKRNVILNNTAAFSTSGFVTLNDYGARFPAFNSLWKARLPENVRNTLTPVLHQVKAVTIDEYVEQTRIQPHFVKIDAESAEYAILEGMERTIDQYHPIISVEVGDMGVEDAPRSRDILDFLIQRGYHPYEFRGAELVPHYVKGDDYQYDNILFIYK